MKILSLIIVFESDNIGGISHIIPPIFFFAADWVKNIQNRSKTIELGNFLHNGARVIQPR